MSVSPYLPATIGASIVVSALVVAIPWLVRFLREPKEHLRSHIQAEVKSIGQVRIWSTILLQLTAAVVLFFLLRSKISILSLTITLFCYVTFVCGLTVSTLMAIPTLRKMWEDPFFKILLAAVPIMVGYLARGYAQLWVGEALGTSAANVPMTLLAATAFLTLLEVGIALSATSVLFETLFFIAEITRKSPQRAAQGRSWRNLLFRWHPLSHGDPDRQRMREQSQYVGLLLLSAISLFACWIGAKAAFALPTSGLGNAILHAIAFDFDAAPAGHCELKGDFEKKMAEQPQPFLKAIPLASSQEKALLVWRDPALFREVQFNALSQEEVKLRRMKVLRVEKCYEPSLGSVAPSPHPA